MRKLIFGLALLLMGVCGTYAQKTALVDMQYILSKLPEQEKANKAVEKLAEKMQQEVTTLEKKAQKLYESYQKEASTLSASAKQSREEEIISTEKAGYELKRKYFAPDGELAKKRQELMKPVEDKVWIVLKAIAQKGDYQIIIDRTTAKIVYADPSIDVSAHVLTMLGIGN